MARRSPAPPTPDSLKAREFSFINSVGGGGDRIAESIGGIVTAEAFLVGVSFKDIGGQIGVVQQIRQGIEQASASFMNKQGGINAIVGVTEALEDGGPAFDATGVGDARSDTQASKMRGNGRTAGFMLEQVAPDEEAG
jgi:hypothetical protein